MESTIVTQCVRENNGHILVNRSCCHGKVRLNTAPKSHRPRPALRVGGKMRRYAGGKCPGMHLNPIDAPAGSSHGEGARAPIINHDMTSLIWQPIRSLRSHRPQLPPSEATEGPQAS